MKDAVAKLQRELAAAHAELATNAAVAEELVAVKPTCGRRSRHCNRACSGGI